MSKQFDYSKHLIIYFLLKRESINRQYLGVIVGFSVSSLINGSDEMLGSESLSLSHILPIRNGVLDEVMSSHEV